MTRRRAGDHEHRQARQGPKEPSRDPHPLTAPTQFVEANGIRFAYRNSEPKRARPSLTAHFRGGMDHWDPAVTDGLAANRPVILFNNAGVASSSGETPDTVDAMARHAADFVGALSLAEVDLLGFSLAGYVAHLSHFKTPTSSGAYCWRNRPSGGEPSQDALVPNMRPQPIPAPARARSKPSCTCSSPRLNAAKRQERRFGKPASS